MNFATVIRGYDKEQVDNTMENLLAMNTHLENENAELRRKLETSKKLIRRFTEAENNLRRDIAESKRAAASMISDTQASGEKFLNSVREECGKIISELDREIDQRVAIIESMKTEIFAFKERLFDAYSANIDSIEKLSAMAEGFSYVPDFTKISEAVEGFENTTSARVDAPEFEEYPQESIFSEAEEKPTGEFVMSLDGYVNEEETASNGDEIIIPDFEPLEPVHLDEMFAYSEAEEPEIVAPAEYHDHTQLVEPVIVEEAEEPEMFEESEEFEAPVAFEEPEEDFEIEEVLEPETIEEFEMFEEPEAYEDIIEPRIIKKVEEYTEYEPFAESETEGVSLQDIGAYESFAEYESANLLGQDLIGEEVIEEPQSPETYEDIIEPVVVKEKIEEAPVKEEKPAENDKYTRTDDDYFNFLKSFANEEEN